MQPKALNEKILRDTRGLELPYAHPRRSSLVLPSQMKDALLISEADT